MELSKLPVYKLGIPYWKQSQLFGKVSNMFDPEHMKLEDVKLVKE